MEFSFCSTNNRAALLRVCHQADMSDGNAQAPSVPAQRVITAHLMRFWPSHQCLLGDISLIRTEQTLGLQSSQHFKACPTDPDDTIFGLHLPTPPTDSQIQAHPSLKEKTWHLKWMPLAFLASFRPQRPQHPDVGARSQMENLNT